VVEPELLLLAAEEEEDYLCRILILEALQTSPAKVALEVAEAAALEAHWEVMEVVAAAEEVVEGAVVVSPPFSSVVVATSDHGQSVANVCFVAAVVAMISGE
jgi:hypothetical protein